ncbi:MAG: hypothetical protein ACE5FI_16160 [Anaerolineales bacterium]
MDNLQVNALVTRALADATFQKDILNGHRRERLTEFELTDQERTGLLSIKAGDVDEFIRQVEGQIRARDWRRSIPDLSLGRATV